MSAEIIKQNHTRILHDPTISEHVKGAQWFERVATSPSPDKQSNHSNSLPLLTGRTPVVFFTVSNKEFVLKRYTRGGLAAGIAHERYFYLGERAVRSFAEWCLLQCLFQQGLPVPRPVAARYRREGLLYTAELITVSCRPALAISIIMTQRTLLEDEWHKIGKTIKRFQRAGVYHADLNAHNILLNEQNSDVFLIDFDRGTQHKRAYYWQVRMLNRLHRSFIKLSHSNDKFHFNKSDWKSLMRGWSQ